MNSQKIIPHLWFDKNVKEAVDFYTSLLPDSKITTSRTLSDTPSGDCDVLSFTVGNYSMMAIGAGPEFTFNPSISFMINFDPSRDKDAHNHIDNVWDKLIDGGEALMPIDTYPFSKRYGWVKDKYGLTWQLMLTDPNGEERPLIIPAMMFVQENVGKAEEATDFYISTFKNSKRGQISRYPKGMEPETEGNIMFTDFQLENQWFAAMESAQDHKFQFNEAVSFLVNCEDQQEIDELWSKLSAVPESEQCGWLKDIYGVSWQIQPKVMNEMMEKGSKEQIDRVTQAFLPMKKFDVAKLQEAYDGK